MKQMRTRITRKINDTDDEQRSTEIEQIARQNQYFDATPDAKQLFDTELCVVDNSGTLSLMARIGNKLYKVDLTEV